MLSDSVLHIPSAAGPRWVEIDLDAVKHNVLQVKKTLRQSTKFMAVVKADAYGCGAVEVSQAVLEAGADMLGVTTVDEGVELRAHGIEAPILVFSPVVSGEGQLFSEYRLTATVAGESSVDELVRASENDPIAVHLKVDTGMNRIGIGPDGVSSAVGYIKQFSQLYLEGMYTHLATTSSDAPFAQKQFQLFQEAAGSLKQTLDVPLLHVCNSAAAVDFPHMHLDMVRIGTLLYGQMPFGRHKRLELKDPWQVRARILHVKSVPSGESVGYGRDYTVKRNTRVGIIPLGFSDGLGVSPVMRPKNLLDMLKMLIKTVLAYLGKETGTPLVSANGKRIRVLGRVGMQMTAVDLTEFNLNEGDTVSVCLRRTNAGSRLPRVFLAEKKIRSIRIPAGYVRGEREYYTG